ncbi:lys-63-specific deubiquitinase BRCC36-like isoform X2 [Varroa jacobsoni]|uniref:MPN domain-containing protein n=1 Tax=Varroa destructor TaxID=109461 RepID=A0A7M7KYM9_VARDE|nr:lys-63-specific deubiquitinase BRCC36-like isoform X2 [Varroa destructor]XP_022710036.1 lys-63-specific deubiquitinase BRCC36-like isoform X2 [Varroa jacobsoni]
MPKLSDNVRRKLELKWKNQVPFNTMVSRVNIYSDVYQACLTHALSTEKEEVMGLLIGQHVNTQTGLEAMLHALMLLRRSDKRRDRVEISAEQQAEASTYAEELAPVDGQPLRVCGWYHSHPHITVHPSHVDVNTQANYQAMDPHFVGLIFSVFSNESSNAKKPSKIEVKCFQAERGTNGPVGVEVTLNLISRKLSPSYPCLRALLSLPKILYEEEKEAYDMSEALCGITEVVGGPLVDVFEATLNSAQKDLKEIHEAL